ncbi:hypothetical protein L3V83_10045 [Thiotrichales bacterium 19X7-9]|nr:hypothetical protein [Thiotrichales bacterium 19X7-9]
MILLNTFCIIMLVSNFAYANASKANQTDDLSSNQEVNAVIKKIDVLQKELDQINAKINQLFSQDKQQVQQPKKTLTPQEMQAQSSSIFIPGGAPRPITNQSHLNQPKAPTPNKDAPKDQKDTADAKSNKTNDNSSGSSYSNNNTNDYNNANNYSTPFPSTANRQVTLSLNDYTSDTPTYTYDSSTSSVTFTFVNDITLTLNFNNFSVFNLKICNSSFENCQTVTDNPSTNEYQLSTSQLNAVNSNLGATQASLSGGTFFVPTFYIQYTATSGSSTLLTGSFSFPTSSSDISCSSASSTVSCQLLDSTQVNFSSSNS